MSQWQFLEDIRNELKYELPPTKPCPFCGNPYTDLEGVHCIAVVCHRCKAEGPQINARDPWESVRQAIYKWNDRVAG